MMAEIISRVFDNFADGIDVGDDSPHDVREAVIAFSETVTEAPFTSNDIERNIALILSIFGYLNEEFQRNYGLNPVHPKPEDVRQYIKDRTSKIIKDVSENSNKRTGIKSRVNKENFKKLKSGKSVSVLEVFYFFGDD
jgi:hypothetical protein